MFYTRKEEGEYKMRKKFRIFSTLTAMVLVVIVMCVGIWAATQAEVTGTGTLSFAFNEIKATVQIDSADSIIENKTSKTFDFSDPTQPTATGEVAFTNLSFSSSKKDYTFTITITNLLGEGNGTLDSTLTIGEVSSPFKVVVTDSDNYLSTTKVVETSVTYTVTISYTGDFDAAAEQPFSMSLVLTKTAA